jgi:AbrB family transcriptional regulator (stage V sporulation protein T)
MKATGIVRRVDDLGRVVVPKEIRKNLKIREGDPVEIFTDHEGQIILKKYSPIGEMGDFARTYAQAMSQIAGHKVIVTDREKVIAVAGGVQKEYQGKNITHELEEVMENRVAVNSAKTKKVVEVVEGEQISGQQQIIYPILSESDVVGTVIIFGKENNQELSETENKIAGVAAAFLGRQMEG